jgi:hypothetical protein
MYLVLVRNRRRDRSGRKEKKPARHSGEYRLRSGWIIRCPHQQRGVGERPAYRHQRDRTEAEGSQANMPRRRGRGGEHVGPRSARDVGSVGGPSAGGELVAPLIPCTGSAQREPLRRRGTATEGRRHVFEVGPGRAIVY